MGHFKWEGVSKDGRRLKGEDEAQSDKDLRRILRARNIKPTKIIPPSIFEIDLGMLLVEHGLASPFGAQELMNFTKQLSIMIGAGVPILQTLEILFKQEKNPTLKLSIKKISAGVSGGKSLSEAMAEEKGFSKLYCNLIKAGESSGVLDQILNKLSLYLEKQEKIKAQIKSALTYPAIVVIVGVVVVAGLLIFVVPKFVEMLKDSGQKIPGVTQMVIDISNFLADWYLILGGIIFIGLAFLSYWVKTDLGKPIWDAFTMQIPVFGQIVIKGNLSSFTRTLSTMLTSGVSLVDSLEICANTLENSVIAKDIMKVKKQVEEGKTFVEPLSQIRYFPDMVAQMVMVGEQTGNMDTMFEKIADIFENDVERSIEAGTKLIEPVILVVLGGVVGVILIAMYLPIFMSGGGAGEEEGGSVEVAE